jgi:hypothetical protein
MCIKKTHTEIWAQYLVAAKSVEQFISKECELYIIAAMEDLADNVNTNNTTYHTSLFTANFTLHRGWHGFLFHLLHMPTEKHSLISVYGLPAITRHHIQNKGPK